jgi:O-antigen ligase
MKNHMFSKISPYLTIHNLGLTGLYFFSLSILLSVSLAMIGLALMFVAFILKAVASPCILRDHLFIISLIFIAYLVPITLFAIHNMPGTASAQITEAFSLIQMWSLGTVVVAFWVAQDNKRIHLLLSLALAGFLIRMAIKVDFQALSQFYPTIKATFGMPTHSFALYCAVSLLGCLIYSAKLTAPSQIPILNILRIGGWLIIVILMAEGLIFSQSRTTWLVFFLVSPPVLWFQMRNRMGTVLQKGKRYVFFIIIAFLCIAGTISLNAGYIKDRIAGTDDSIEKIIKGKTTHTSPDSLIFRYHAWRYGIEKWMQSPFFGWGPGSTKYLLQNSGKKNVLNTSFKDFHNTYLETLLQVGLIGLFFLFLSLWLIFRSLWKAYRKEWLSTEIFLLTFGGLALFLITTFTNLRTGDHIGRFFLSLFCGIAYAIQFSSSNGLEMSGNVRNGIGEIEEHA